MSDMQALNVDTTNEIPKRPMPKNINLSVFQYPYSWKSWRGFWHNLRYFFRCWRPAWDRATKGMCRADTWNVDCSLTGYMIKVLIEYRNCTRGWPFEDFATFEDWIKFIDELIDKLEFTRQDPEEELNEYFESFHDRCLHKPHNQWGPEEDALYKQYWTRVRELTEKQAEVRKEVFMVLAKHLPDIWW